MASGIYLITCVVSGDRYVGSALRLYVRRRDHWNALKRGDHPNSRLQRSWAKYGPDTFVFTVLERVEERTQLILREQYWIDMLEPEFNLRPIANSQLGFRHSVQTKQQIGAKKRGRRLAPEHAAKIRAALLELGPRMADHLRGVPLTAEHRAKVSAALKGHKVGPEYRARLSAANLGKPFSAERRAAISQGRKGVSPAPRTEAHRQALSEALRGRAPTPQALEASAIARRGKPLTAEHKAKVSAGLTGKKRPPRSPEHIAKLKAAAQARAQDPAYRAKISATMRARGIQPSLETRTKAAAARRSS